MSTDWTGFIAALGACVLACIIAWQVFATARTAIRKDGEKEYREVIDGVTEAQKELVDLQKQAVEQLADLRSRVAAIEKLLREVG